MGSYTILQSAEIYDWDQNNWQATGENSAIFNHYNILDFQRVAPELAFKRDCLPNIAKEPGKPARQTHSGIKTLSKPISLPHVVHCLPPLPDSPRTCRHHTAENAGSAP